VSGVYQEQPLKKKDVIMNFEEMRFVHIVRDLAVDDYGFRHAMEVNAPAERSYVIVFTARSGSTWLTKLLSSTGVLGYPEEYINPDFVRDVAKFLNCREPAGFLESLKRRRKTTNGIFGIEAREVDIRLFGENEFFQAFRPDTIFFNLWRQNIVAQAISLYRAVATQRFHSNDETGSRPPPDYDAAAIQNWLSHVAAEENDNLEMLRRHHLDFRNLCYETIVADRNATLRFFTAIMGLDIDASEFLAPGKDELQKIGDDWNLEAERQFRAEHAGFLNRIEAGRLVRKLVAPEGQGR
jgi:LPS sulfotransferase NodH